MWTQNDAKILLYEFTSYVPFEFVLEREIISKLSDDDQDLWDDDPHEYIRSKFDVFEDFISPNTAAAQVLHTACSKRKQVLQTTVDFCMTKFNQVSNFMKPIRLLIH